jgi:hypothetical protein
VVLVGSDQGRNSNVMEMACIEAVPGGVEHKQEQNNHLVEPPGDEYQDKHMHSMLAAVQGVGGRGGEERHAAQEQLACVQATRGYALFWAHPIARWRPHP